MAVGAVILNYFDKESPSKDILLVKTHKWGDRYSIIGGKIEENETLYDGLKREVFEETGLKGEIGKHILTFDKLKDSGFFKEQHMVFCDYIFKANSGKIILNDEAQEYVWVPQDKINEYDIEPNAKKVIDIVLNENN